MSQASHRSRRVAATALALILVSAGCAENEWASPNRDEQQQESAVLKPPQVLADEDTAVSAGAAALRPSARPSVDTDAPPADGDPMASELAGMYGWDPEGGLHNAVWSGVLVIDAPCVYLQVNHQNGDEAPRGETLNSFVRLPEPLTRYDPATGEVWVGDDGPMASGDEVVLVGSEGWQIHWHQPDEDTTVFKYVYSLQDGHNIPVCTAHVSFYAASMSPPGSEDAETIIDSRQGRQLAGLFPWDTEQAATDYGLDGVLTIEPPCVYVDREHRYFLRLPRPMTRFDPDNNAIWVDEHGPMTTGDEVTTWGGGPQDSVYGSEFYEGTCKAHGEVFSPALQPRDETWDE